MNYKLISSILKGAWAIEPSTAKALTPFVFSVLNGESVVLDQEKEAAYDYDYEENMHDYEPENKSYIRVIPVKGVLTKEGGLCSYGTADIGSWIKEADNDPNVSAIVLDIDTPGGSLDGTEVFGNIIKECQKPVIGFINGLMASAGMWIGSACNKLIASTEFDKVGSIGVMTSFLDMIPYYEELGAKYHEVYSKFSKDKNLDFREMLEGNYEKYRKETLDPLAERFQAVIKQNRPNAREDQLTGKTYFAKDALGTLIDEIGTFEYAIQEAKRLSEINLNINTTTMSTENKDIIKDENKLIAFFKNTFGLKTVDEKKAEKEAEEASQVASSLEEKVNENAQLAAELAEAVEKNVKLAQTLETIKNEIEELKQTPGAPNATVQKETDGTDAADPAMIDLGEGPIEEQYAAFKSALDKAHQ